MSNKEIGEKLHISESTVKNHLRNILAKLHQKNRMQLIAYAYNNGLIRD
jgi:DNA-binding NarL/FixJ family response regulator